MPGKQESLSSILSTTKEKVKGKNVNLPRQQKPEQMQRACCRQEFTKLSREQGGG
jgi:hypothetical protein